MDGSLSYGGGAAGIFTHVDGPFAGPTSKEAVEAMGAGVIDETSWFTPDEVASISKATAEALSSLAQVKSMFTAGEKSTLEELFEAAGLWSAEASKPWYKRPESWAWIAVGATILGGGGYMLYRYKRTH